MRTEQVNKNCHLLSASGLAEMLGLSKRQVFRLNSCGKVPASMRIGGSVRWANSTIESWIDMGCPDRQTFDAMKGGNGHG